jgi:crotonobetainyl-CoA:carnitine CoA-transferase CaiB-like acyl-CoA transferase
VGAANQNNWERFLEVIGAPELNEDPRFGTNAQRTQNLPALIEILNSYLVKDTTQNWLDLMEAAKLPAGPVNDILQMHTDPQALARDMIVEVKHPVAGAVETIGHPVKFSRTPAKVQKGAPVLGQHSREVLTEMGYAADQIEALIQSQAVIAA